ncbi:putative peroxidase [Nocardia brasiliensis NBRC 14402]|uniref:Dyp-type peroxidase n=1 Tax=Nocardia brasiliensis TaxID=37326 RepID=UPI00030A4C3E|nr:Dyp-type peroxidase [Nocardia brasiliensis]ASF06787.1 peroxidase [Nocardia brasiliensis]GAJ85368.1 putative peroxidase [Nocardia brasiliensis NBRC 14402]SUB48012.1 Probable deferrochelatase/peroxidase EfeN precursor [Nocardia brasiliensis]
MAERTGARPSLNRRRLLGGGAAAAGAAGLGWGALTVARDEQPPAAIEPFYGPHQAGIATAPQTHATFVAFDLKAGVTRDDIIGILKIWTGDAARLTQGRPALADTEPELAQRPSRLTVTIGLGPAVFASVPQRRPAWLRPLPPFAIDRLDPAWSDGDLLLQVCADEATTVSHAVRVLCRSVASLVRVRWVQRGFRDAAPGRTPRNLMGQVDGTVNIAPGTPDFDRLVWDDGAGQPWLAGGTSLVLRRIAMTLDTWDEIDQEGRELTVGRTVATGAPLTGTDEFDEPDFAAVDANGIPVIPPSSHIARAHHTHDGERFLRRGYNYDDAPAAGQISNSGLLFAAYQRDVDAQFLPVQQRLAEFDALNVWTTPVGSAVFVIPPGVAAPGGYIGQSLFES